MLSNRSRVIVVGLVLVTAGPLAMAATDGFPGLSAFRSVSRPAPLPEPDHGHVQPSAGPAGGALADLPPAAEPTRPEAAHASETPADLTPPPEKADPEIVKRLKEIEEERTYIEQLRRLAVVKRELCDTGFGSPDICGASTRRTHSGPDDGLPVAGSPSDAPAVEATGAGTPASAGSVRPSSLLVQHIVRVDGQTEATLVIPGTRERVTVNGKDIERAARLPDGSQVVLIDDVARRVEVVDGRGRRIALPWMGVSR